MRSQTADIERKQSERVSNDEDRTNVCTLRRVEYLNDTQ